MLQTGAFKSAEDADAMRARLPCSDWTRACRKSRRTARPFLPRAVGPYRELDDLSGIRRTRRKTDRVAGRRSP